MLADTGECARDKLEREGVGENLIDELGMAAMRVNYGQNLGGVHAFVAAVGLCGTTGDLWCVKGGNKQVAHRCLEEASADLISARVSRSRSV